VIKAEDVQRIDGPNKFQCDAENPCKLYAFENFDSNGNENDFNASASVPLSYALSTLACPETEPRVAGSGAAAIRPAAIQWQSETCHPPASLNVSFATSNSVNGKQAFVNGLTDADFAMSGVPLTDSERAALSARNVQALHVPVALGSLVLAYNFWYDKNGDGTPDQVLDLQLSPATVAGVMEGRIANTNDPAIKADNLEHYPNGFPSRQIIPVGRADNCAATWWLTSWLNATAKDAWEAGGDSFKGGPTAIFPAGNGVDLKTGTDAVAQEIRTFPGHPPIIQGIPSDAWIGFVYLSDALKLGLPVVALQNKAGKYVKPTSESVNAAISAGLISDEGLFSPNFQSIDAKAYPLPVVTYAIVPSGTSAAPPLDPSHELVLSQFLRYAITDGQRKAELRGYVPLPDALSSKSDAAIGQIYKPLAPTPTPSSAPATSEHPVSASSSPAARALDAVVPGLGTVVSHLLPHSEPAPAQTSSSAGPASPVDRTVSGIVKLAGGGRTPITVSAFLWLGAIVAIVGRALWVVSSRPGRRSGSSRPRILESAG
jgi:phosphate transport system substrate-binding protein